MSKKIGFAVTGSFCTFTPTLTAMRALADEGFELTPIFSFNVAELDTRFFKAADFRREVESICQKPAIDSIVAAEPLGTSNKLDLIVVAPCTGNTLAKIANGITDTPVTMAVKAHLRNSRPVLLAISSNDALGANAKNLGLLLNTKNIYFVPFGQDNPQIKTKSMLADLSKVADAAKAALDGIQLQPLLQIY